MTKKKTRVELDLTRRDFVRVAATAAGSAVVAQAVTTGPLSPFGELKQRQVAGGPDSGHPQGEHHWGMLINLQTCIGCEYCQRACSSTNDLAPDQACNIVLPDQTSTGSRRSFSRPSSPLPEVQRRRRGVVEKCTFCVHRIDAGLAAGLMPGVDREATPACVNICPVGARVFGDLLNPDSPVSQVIAANPTLRLREELGTEPSVYHIPAEEAA